MPIFDWSDEFSVNVRELDDQHKKLVDMINELYESVNGTNDPAAVRDILDKLLDYTAYHFETEEQLLERFGYPTIDKHRKEHNVLSWRVLDLRSRFESGEGVRAAELLDFLTGWLKNHILYSDKQYGTFLNSKGMH